MSGFFAFVATAISVSLLALAVWVLVYLACKQALIDFHSCPECKKEREQKQ